MLAFLTSIDVDSHKWKWVLLLQFDSTTSYPLSHLDSFNMHVGEFNIKFLMTHEGDASQLIAA